MTESATIGAARAAALLALAWSALLLAGCAGSAAANLPQARLAAIRHNQRGVEAELTGNQGAALAEFSEAFRLHGSIENWDGMAVAQTNLARTHRLRGDLASARSAMERALSLLSKSCSELAAELYFENAKLHLALGDLAAAQHWAVQAAQAEQGGDAGRRLNLLGLVLSRAGFIEQARLEAEKALELNRVRGDATEEANSLRLLGEIELAQGKYDQAGEHFQAALLLDKKLGLGKKIALDLRGLGSASLKKDELPAAIGYYRRALEVSLSGRDSAAAAEDRARLAELHRMGAGSQQEGRMIIRPYGATWEGRSDSTF